MGVKHHDWQLCTPAIGLPGALAGSQCHTSLPSFYCADSDSQMMWSVRDGVSWIYCFPFHRIGSDDGLFTCLNLMTCGNCIKFEKNVIVFTLYLKLFVLSLNSYDQLNGFLKWVMIQNFYVENKPDSPRNNCPWLPAWLDWLFAS